MFLQALGLRLTEWEGVRTPCELLAALLKRTAEREPPESPGSAPESKGGSAREDAVTPPSGRSLLAGSGLLSTEGESQVAQRWSDAVVQLCRGHASPQDALEIQVGGCVGLKLLIVTVRRFTRCAAY